MRRKIVFILSLLMLSQVIFAQSPKELHEINSGQWMFDPNPSSFVLLYKELTLDQWEKNNKKNNDHILELFQKEKINMDSFKYAKMNYRGKQYLITRKRKNSNLRIFKILKDGKKYFILCADSSNLSNCKVSTFIYDKPENKLQRVQRAFSFSLKRNLIFYLKKFDINLPMGYQNMNFSEILAHLPS